MRHDDRGFGKLIRFAQPIVGVIATVALILAVVSVSNELDNRRASAADMCRVLRSIIQSSTPPAKAAKGRAFIAKNGLADCRAFARKVVK